MDRVIEAASRIAAKYDVENLDNLAERLGVAVYDLLETEPVDVVSTTFCFHSGFGRVILILAYQYTRSTPPTGEYRLCVMTRLILDAL